MQRRRCHFHTSGNQRSKHHPQMKTLQISKILRPTWPSLPPQPALSIQAAKSHHHLPHRRATTAYSPKDRAFGWKRPNVFKGQNRCMASASVERPSQTSSRGEIQASHHGPAAMTQEPTIHSLFEENTGTWQYVVADPYTKKAIIIDAVLDYAADSRTISTSTADNILATIARHGYHVEKILETHAHADHLTAASYLQHRLLQQQGSRPPICIGKRIRQVQERFAARYGIPADEYEDVFDHLFEDYESFELGQLTVNVMHLQGHTPDHIGYHIAGRCTCKSENYTMLIQTWARLLRRLHLPC